MFTWCLSWAKAGNSSRSPNVDQSNFPHISTPLIMLICYLPFSYITKLPLSITSRWQKSPLGLNLLETPWDALRNDYYNYETRGVSSLSVLLSKMWFIWVLSAFDLLQYYGRSQVPSARFLSLASYPIRASAHHNDGSLKYCGQHCFWRRLLSFQNSQITPGVARAWAPTSGGTKSRAGGEGLKIGVGNLGLC